MFIEFGNPIKVDKEDFMRDTTLLIVHDKRQLRFRSTFVKDTPVEVDIVGYEYSNLRLDKTTAGISINGEERIRSKAFNLFLGYDILGRKWRIRGEYDHQIVNLEEKKLKSLLVKIKPIIGGSKS